MSFSVIGRIQGWQISSAPLSKYPFKVDFSHQTRYGLASEDDKLGRTSYIDFQVSPATRDEVNQRVIVIFIYPIGEGYAV